MAITAYQVDSVLNAYTRQSRFKIRTAGNQDSGTGMSYRDVVSISRKEEQKAEELEKISYNLRDVILKGK